jgi:hypothetical protein
LTSTEIGGACCWLRNGPSSSVRAKIVITSQGVFQVGDRLVINMKYVPLRLRRDERSGRGHTSSH